MTEHSQETSPDQRIKDIAADGTLRAKFAAFASVKNHIVVADTGEFDDISSGMLESVAEMAIEYYDTLGHLALHGSYDPQSNGMEASLIERWLPDFQLTLEEASR